jgi:hypothetical protein
MVHIVCRRFHRFCPERVGHVGLSNHGTDHGVKGTIHPFHFAIVFRGARRPWFVLDTKGLESRYGISLVFTPSINSQPFEVEASFWFDGCEIFFESFCESGGRSVVDLVCTSPSCSFIDEEEVVNRLVFD